MGGAELSMPSSSLQMHRGEELLHLHGERAREVPAVGNALTLSPVRSCASLPWTVSLPFPNILGFR